MIRKLLTFFFILVTPVMAVPLRVSPNVETFLESSDFAAARVALGVEIGANVQAYDADLTLWGAITPSLNMRSFAAAADYAAMRSQLSLVVGTNVQAYDSDLSLWGAITPSSNMQSFAGAADYAAMRSLLGLVIGTNVQAYDPDLTTWAGITPSANAQSMASAANYSAMRTLLGLVPGTDVQAFDGDLSLWGAITPSSNMQSFAGAADYAAMRTLLGLVIGTNVQAYSANLASWAATTPTSYTGSSTIVTLGTVASGTFSGVLDGSVTMTMGSDATGDIYYRDSSGFLHRLAKGADGTVLTLASGLPSWATVSASAAGSSNYVQYNASGSLAAEAAFAYDPTTDTLSVVNLSASGTFTVGTLNTTNFNISSGIAPTTDGGAALGDSTHGFSALRLSSGGSINIANSNWVATHTSGILTVGTGDLRVTTAGTNGASVVTTAGTQSLTNKKLGSLTTNGLVTTSGSDGTLSVTVPGTGVPTALAAAANGTGGVATVDGSKTLTNTTLDGAATGNVVKLKGYLVLSHPHLADGTGATIGTTATGIGYGHATFSNSADQAANYVEYYLQVPEDIDTSVALRARLKVTLGNTDTATQRYVLSSVSVADSAVPTASTLANAINVDYAGDASGASGDVETSAWTTLTSWNGALTAGQTWRIRLARDGDATQDASTVNSTELGLVIEYGISQ